MKIWKCCIAALLVMSSAVPLMAIPAGFNIQGRLTDANGINKDGTFQIKFAVYTADVGGTLVWDKNIPSVTVKNGNFQVILQGQGDNGGQLEAAVKDLEAAYVEIKVGADPALVPRQPLLRSPFSVSDRVSGTVDVLIQSDSQASGSGLIAMRTGNTDRVTILNNGNVGIGTNSPAEKLSVAGSMSVNGALSADNLVGAIMHFVTSVCPAGWLAADGRTVLENDYPKLAAAMGKTGAGSFILPDLRGVFVRGWDSGGGSARGLDAGRVSGSFQEDELKAHTHGGLLRWGTGLTWNFTSSHWYGAYESSSNAFGGNETRPKNIALLGCVKY